MNNFEFYCPTKIIFGKGTIAKLPELIDKSNKVLITYGGGSIKRNGVYEQVKKALEGYNVLEFGGIEPNPKYETSEKSNCNRKSFGFGNIRNNSDNWISEIICITLVSQ